MSKETREHLSSLMDGEISREASRFLVRRLGSDEELCSTWARYHVVRDCLRDQEGGFSSEDLCARVNQALENDRTHTARSGPATRWLRPVAGMAIAASVALVAVMAVNPGGVPAVEVTPDLAGTTEPFTSPQGLSTSTVSSRAVSSQRMNSYLLRHYQAAGSGNGRGIVGFVPVLVTSQPVGAEPGTETENRETPEGNGADSGTP
jgi:sigma-E factor negative regulatory protein RseA